MASVPVQSDFEFGLAVVRRRADALMEELGLLKRRPRPESIHDTRVQSRRLRAALEAFRDLFPRRPWQELYGSVRQITRMLGKPRETEVLVALLEDLPASDLAGDLCREYLLARFQKRFAKLNRRLRKKTFGMNFRQVRAQVRTLLNETVAPESSAPSAPAPEPPEGVRAAPQGSSERARRELAGLSQPILSFRARYHFRRASDERLHDLRIAAKKLRYACDIFAEIWPGGLETEIQAAKALQEAGGHYHDWCVLQLELKSEIRRLSQQRASLMAFQAGRLLARVEDTRAALKNDVLPALLSLQEALVRSTAVPAPEPLSAVAPPPAVERSSMGQAGRPGEPRASASRSGHAREAT